MAKRKTVELRVRDMNQPSSERILEFKIGVQRALERALAKAKILQKKHNDE